MENQYTERMDNRYGDLDVGSDTFEEDLLEILKDFRPFGDAMNEFLRENGYTGDPADPDEKAGFIRDRYNAAGIKPPREIRLWFAENQRITRETAFSLCFAFGLDVEETEACFRRILCLGRSFDCHDPAEAVYYWCLRNRRDWRTARDVLSRLPGAKARQGRIDPDNVLYTGTILRELDQLDSPEALLAYLTENQSRFLYNNVTATEAIRRLWREITEADGLLDREHQRFGGVLENYSSRRQPNVWRDYLAIMGVEQELVKELPKDRTLKAVLDQLPRAVSDAFPGRENIIKLMSGQHADYEVVRKCLILLAFYQYWCRLALRKNDYDAGPEDEERCRDRIDQHLTDAGYMALYPGNPYDWVFLYACSEGSPLPAFRYIWRALTIRYLAEASEKPNEEADGI